MKFAVSFLILILIACSSTPNPISRTAEPVKDTILVHDTIVREETRIETEYIFDSIFLVDSFLQLDTIIEEQDLIDDAEQILKCSMSLSRTGNSAGNQYELYVRAAAFAVDQDLNNSAYTIEYFKVNDKELNNFTTALGLSCVNKIMYFEELPRTIKVEMQTSKGYLEGEVTIPTFDRIAPYFKGVKVDSGQYYITTLDSLSLAWNATDDDYYQVSYSFMNLDFNTREITTDNISTTTKSSYLVYSNRYFDIYGNGEISELSVIGFTGERYGSSSPNMIGDGIGWLNCSAAEIGDSKSIFVKYEDPYNNYILLD